MMKWKAETERLNISPDNTPEDVFAAIASAFSFPFKAICDYNAEPVVKGIMEVLVHVILHECSIASLFRNTIFNLEKEIQSLENRNNLLQVECDSNQVKLTELANSCTELAKQFDAEKKEKETLKYNLEETLKQNEKLTEQLGARNKDLYGTRSEKMEQVHQDTLSDEENKNPLSEESEDNGSGEEESGSGNGAPKGKSQTPGKPKKPKKPKQKGKRDKDLKDLPEQTYFDIDPQKLDEQYGKGNWKIITWKNHRALELVPAAVYIKITKTPVIMVKPAEPETPEASEAKKEEKRIVTVWHDNVLFPKSLCSESLLTFIIIHKFALYVPHYRLENDVLHLGFAISRQCMTNWVNRAATDFFRPVYDYLTDQLSGYQYQQCDETTYTIILDGRNPGSKSFIWIHCSSERCKDRPPIIIYCLELTRAGSHLEKFFAKHIKEGTFQIHLEADAFSGYISLVKKHPELFVLHLCLDHARRRFVYALDAIKKYVDNEEKLEETPEWKALKLIGKIYNEEGKLDDMAALERLIHRQSEVEPEMDKFFKYLHELQDSDTVFGATMKDAINYSLEHEPHLRNFLKDGNMPISNANSERNARKLVMIRNNSLFSTSINGAESVAIILSLIETAKANNADPYYYILYLLKRMPKRFYSNQTDENLDQMVPWSKEYRQFEEAERRKLLDRVAPEGNEMPVEYMKRTRKASQPQNTQAVAAA